MKYIQVIRHISDNPSVGYIHRMCVTARIPFEYSQVTKTRFDKPNSLGDYVAMSVLSIIGGISIIVMIVGRF